jgi:glutamate carboxypeptidase
VVPELSQLVQRLYDLDDLECGVTINVGTIDGTQVDDETGTSYGQMGVDVRVPTHEAAETVRSAIQNLEAQTPGVTVKVQGDIKRPPLERTARNRRLWRSAQDLGERLGLDLEDGRAGGGSDGNVTSRHTPTLDGLGAVGDGAHAAHEHIRIDETLERCDLLALLLLEPPLAEQGSS